MRDVGPRAAARDGASPPEERSLTQAKYIGSFPRADAPLDPPLPEVAFIGRSNVGKSTLLNALVGQRIAKTSGTPGKTRAMNVFLVNLGTGDEGRGTGIRASPPSPVSIPPSLYFLDLPGYGYARASRADRTAFRGLVKYALQREGLHGVVWLLDMRHPPSADDRLMQDVLAEGETHVLAALTKADKLSSTERRKREAELRAELGLPEEQIVVTSARTREGIVELREAIEELIQKASA